MSRPIIEVRNLSKKYRLGAIGATSIREQAARIWDRIRGVPHPDPQDYWALRDVSFDIQPGEVVGVIGRNGAGKSTLLKILSRITEPTSGTARIRGRVASLLEVGTGFHPELTGRENVYLNGAILGMTRTEVKSKFDEIVAFAEIEQFIDTPVKRYSSGMYVRLAFAVAAHLEPEILIVDEVLAVGDAQFQTKCLGRMKDVAQKGRTILFVSHNMNALTTLCESSLLFQQGTLKQKGALTDTIPTYNNHNKLVPSDGIHLINKKSYIRSIEILENGKPSMGLLRAEQTATIRFLVTPQFPLKNPKLSAGVTDALGQRIFAVGTSFGPDCLPRIDTSTTISVSFRLPALIPGLYTVDVGLYDKASDTTEEHFGAAFFEIVNTNYLRMPAPYFTGLGQILVKSLTTTTNPAPNTNVSIAN